MTQLMMKYKKTTIWSIILTIAVSFFAFFGGPNGLLKFYNTVNDNVEHLTLVEQVHAFDTHSFIIMDEVRDGKTRLTYRSCYAPKALYDLDFMVNGRLVFHVKDVDPTAYGKFYTDHCQTYTGQWLDFELKPGDLLVIRYDWKEHGIVDTIYIKPFE